MKKIKWDKILLLQILANFLISIFLLVTPNKAEAETTTNMIMLIALTLIGGLNFFRNKNHGLKVTTNWLNIIALPFIFSYCLGELGHKLIDFLPNLTILWEVAYLLFYFVIFIPDVVCEYSKVKNTILRLICIQWLVGVIYLFGLNLSLPQNEFLHIISQYSLTNAITFFVIAYFLIKGWGFKFQWNLKFRKTPNFQIWVLVLLVAFSIWGVFSDSFLRTANSISGILWKWDFSYYEFTFRNLVKGLEPGILEETNRYLDLVVLLYGMRKVKYRVPLAILISTLIFSLNHLNGAQIITAFGWGCLWAVLYLYTGQLWLPMIMHAGFDFLESSKGYLAVQPNSFNEIYGNNLIWIIDLVVPLAVVVFMMFGKRRKFIENNVEQIIKMK